MRSRNVGSISAGHSFRPAPIAVSEPDQPGRRPAASTAAPASIAGTRSKRKYAIGPTAGTNHSQNVSALPRARPLARQSDQVKIASTASIEAANSSANASAFVAAIRYCGSMIARTGSGYSCSTSRIDPPWNSVCRLRA